MTCQLAGTNENPQEILVAVKSLELSVKEGNPIAIHQTTLPWFQQVSAGQCTPETATLAKAVLDSLPRTKPSKPVGFSGSEPSLPLCSAVIPSATSQMIQIRGEAPGDQLGGNTKYDVDSLTTIISPSGTQLLVASAPYASSNLGAVYILPIPPASCTLAAGGNQCQGIVKITGAISNGNLGLTGIIAASIKGVQKIIAASSTSRTSVIYLLTPPTSSCTADQCSSGSGVNTITFSFSVSSPLSSVIIFSVISIQGKEYLTAKFSSSSKANILYIIDLISSPTSCTIDTISPTSDCVLFTQMTIYVSTLAGGAAGIKSAFVSPVRGEDKLFISLPGDNSGKGKICIAPVTNIPQTSCSIDDTHPGKSCGCTLISGTDAAQLPGLLNVFTTTTGTQLMMLVSKGSITTMPIPSANCDFGRSATTPCNGVIITAQNKDDTSDPLGGSAEICLIGGKTTIIVAQPVDGNKAGKLDIMPLPTSSCNLVAPNQCQGATAIIGSDTGGQLGAGDTICAQLNSSGVHGIITTAYLANDKAGAIYIAPIQDCDWGF